MCKLSWARLKDLPRRQVYGLLAVGITLVFLLSWFVLRGGAKEYEIAVIYTYLETSTSSSCSCGR